MTATLMPASGTSDAWLRLEELFWERIEITPGCWLWAGATNGKGYGQLSFRPAGRKTPVTIRASRLAYELFIGPIPPGYELDHLCHTMDLTCIGGENCWHRACANPADHQIVTPAENKRRSQPNATLANWQRRKTHCPQGHPYEGANLRVYGNRRQCVTCINDRNAVMSDQRAQVSRAKALSFFAQIQNDISALDCDSVPPAEPTGLRGRPRKTHCKRGHPLVDPNLIHRNDGQRACKACDLLRNRNLLDVTQETA